MLFYERLFALKTSYIFDVCPKYRETFIQMNKINLFG